MAFPPMKPFAIPAIHPVPVSRSELTAPDVVRCQPRRRAQTTNINFADHWPRGGPDTPTASLYRQSSQPLGLEDIHRAPDHHDQRPDNHPMPV
jgi:hypothetical protein